MDARISLYIYICRGSGTEGHRIEKVAGSLAQSRDIFFLYSPALAITCHLRDSQAVASNAVFPAARRPISTRLGQGSGLHPPEIWNAGIDYACLQDASSINPPIFQSHAFLPTCTQKTERTTTNDGPRKVQCSTNRFPMSFTQKIASQSFVKSLLSLRVVC